MYYEHMAQVFEDRPGLGPPASEYVRLRLRSL